MARFKYIHEHPDWPNLHWRRDELTDLLASVRHQQGMLLGQMTSLGFDLRQEAELNAITENVVKTSEIEGEVLNQGEVRSSVASRLGIDIGGVAPANRDVDGIVDLMLDATANCEEELTRERLFGWHSLLFPSEWTSAGPITVGAWRGLDRGPMRVVSGFYGQERVHFEAPSADRLETEMGAFLTWFNAPGTGDDVLKAALAHLWFVTIHPFDDGNGRIARAIADLALARSDGVSQRFYSMSSQIRRERSDYYTTLELTQKGAMDITNWMIWFLDCLGRAIVDAQDVVAAAMAKVRFWEAISHVPLNDRQRKVLRRLVNGFEGNMTSTKWARMTKSSQDTALRDISDLVSKGVLERGPSGGRSTSYSLISAESGRT